MKELEKQIMKNRPEFDSDEPRSGHFDRFDERLRNQRPSRRLNIRHAIQIAASVAIILASGIVIIQKSKSGDKVAKAEIPAEVIEAGNYYMHQVNGKVEQIKGFSFDSEQEKSILLKELNDLDIYHQKLMSDLETNPSDERVINAMIKHYQMKLEIMDQIINQLNQIKSQKIENHEEESI